MKTEKVTLGEMALSEIVREQLMAEVGEKVKLKLKLDGEDRGYLGTTKQSGKNFICDLSKEEATVFLVKKTKYSKDGYNTYEVTNGKQKGRWLDYHSGAGNGELFAESHSFFEFDIAIWLVEDKTLYALAGKEVKTPVRGEKDSPIPFVSLNGVYKTFEVTEEKQ